MKYQHSNSFASLKNIKEGVTGNLTTYQYLEVLDYFLESAIDPLATSVPNFLDSYYAVIVAWQAHKPSIKYTRGDKHDLPCKLFNAITTTGKQKRHHQKSMLVNRGLLFYLLVLFKKIVNNYEKLHNPALNISKGRRLWLLRRYETNFENKNLYPAILKSKHFASKAYKFKELITQKYMRLALMTAKRTYTELNCEVPLDDLVQIYLVYLNKAIDRCDSRQGVLTTYIQNWFYPAKAEATKIKQESSNSSYDELESVGLPITHTEANFDYDALQELSYQSKLIDPTGVVRFELAIPEFLTKKQLTKLQLFITPPKENQNGFRRLQSKQP